MNKGAIRVTQYSEHVGTVFRRAVAEGRRAMNRNAKSGNIIVKHKRNRSGDNTTHCGTSKLARKIAAAASNRPSFEPKAYNTCTPKDISKCTLARGIENLFVAGIVQRVFKRISKGGQKLKFEECFYMPSTYIEGKCGSDVSIGYYQRPRRVRLMHKLVQKWCDTDWSWNITERERKHIQLIVKQCRDTKKRNSGSIKPFASFSICYCLHEFRRIGTEGVPTFEDKRRHLFIGLEPLCTYKITGNNFKFKIQRKGQKYTVICSVAEKEIELTPLSWDEFLEEAIDPLVA